MLLLFLFACPDSCGAFVRDEEKDAIFPSNSLIFMALFACKLAILRCSPPPPPSLFLRRIGSLPRQPLPVPAACLLLPRLIWWYKISSDCANPINTSSPCVFFLSAFLITIVVRWQIIRIFHRLVWSPNSSGAEFGCSPVVL
jgi:hypothetical protein